jgi:thiamine pyrophosphate-dependent acetolactate synthase large subunit-like protein
MAETASGQDDFFERRALVADILRDRPEELLVVTGLGSPTYDVAAAGDDPRNFYLWGAMGSAATVGLGLALARPQSRVLVITGDGELLMAVGALATIGVARPNNLAIAVLDNRAYGETGGQASHTAAGVDLAAIARASGFARAENLDATQGTKAVRSLLHESPGPVLAVCSIRSGENPRVMPSRDGHYLRARFRAAINAA